MKKREEVNIKNYTLRINYSSESVSLCHECCSYLLENNFFQNNEEDNIKLLEHAIINYSILKLNDWKIDLDEIGIENWNNLEDILNALNNHIPTDEEKEGFFAQYIHCIIFIYSKIKKQEPIEWKKTEHDKLFAYIFKNGELRKVITNKQTPSYQIPIKLLEKIKSFYPKEKNSILTK